MPQHPECRHCDGGFYAHRVGDDLVCSSCGAEWNPIMVEDEEFEEFDDDF
jgi:Uncharacterized Zn-ribbon-containing protein involved in phosphonate metabolism